MSDSAPVHGDVALPAWRDRWTILSLVTLCYWCATQAMRPVVAFRLDDLGASDAVIGLILGANSATTFLLAVPSGWFVDRVGFRSAVATGFGGMALAGLGFALSGGLATVTLVVLGAGMVELAAWVSLQSLASHAGSGQRLRRQLALFSFAWGAGLAAGPLLGAWVYEHFGFARVGLMYGTLAAAGALVAMLLPLGEADSTGGPEPSPRQMLSAARGLWRRAPVRAVLLSSFVVLFVYGIRNSFYPLYLERAGLSLSTIGVLMTVIGVASLVVRLALPSVLRRVGASRILVASMWLPILAISATPLLGSTWLLVVAAVVAGLGLGMNPPVTVELMARHTQAAGRGMAMGLRVSANRLAQVVQPLLFGVVSTMVGLPVTFAVSGALLGAMAARTRTHEARPG